MVRYRWRGVLTLMGILILTIGVGMMVKPVVEKDGELAKFPDRGVPRINIALSEATLKEIKEGSKETRYEGNELSVYDGDFVRKFEGVEVKGRGNGTWTREKKPYQIKFEKKVDLLGMGKAKKWVLLANAMDASNLRTSMAVELEEILGMKYRFGGKFVEVYVGGEYEGLYYLTHKVEVGKKSVDLKNETGVLVELDNLYYETEEYYETGNGDHLVVRGAVDEEVAGEAMKEFVREYNEFEKAVARQDYGRVKELVDVRSFAQYYLLSEFSVNPDAYWTSFYMYKDGLGDKIHAGPGWDFDLAFANRWWGNWMGEAFYSPVQTMVRKGEFLSRETYEEMGLEDRYDASTRLSKIVYDLMEIPEFEAEVKRVYNEMMSGRGKELEMKLWWLAEGIADLAEIDERKWGEEGRYYREVETMAEWIRRRYAYFEEMYGDGAAMSETANLTKMREFVVY